MISSWIFMYFISRALRAKSFFKPFVQKGMMPVARRSFGEGSPGTFLALLHQLLNVYTMILDSFRLRGCLNIDHNLQGRSLTITRDHGSYIFIRSLIASTPLPSFTLKQVVFVSRSRRVFFLRECDGSSQQCACNLVCSSACECQ